jgi:hypothetical protein
MGVRRCYGVCYDAFHVKDGKHRGARRSLPVQPV